MKRIIITLLLLAMLLPMTACGSDTPAASDTDTSAENTAEGNVAPETEPQLELPDIRFDGASFRLLNHDPAAMPWVNPQLDESELTGEVLNDAIFNRNRAVEAQYGVVFKPTEISMDMMNNIANTIMAGDDAYEVIQHIDRDAMSIAQQGLLHSMGDLPHIDLSKPWWSQFMNENLTVKNKAYFAYGDYNLSTFDFTHLMAFNKDLYRDNGMEDTYGSLYTVVSEGGWTFDLYSVMAESAVRDLDGDGAMTSADQYGLISAAKQVLPCFWISGGVQSVVKNDKDIPTYDLPTNAAFEQVISKIFSITRDTGSWNGELGHDDTLFKNGQALFNNTTFYFVSSLRDMETDFGIVPYPKYDETQSTYLSRVEGGMLTMIPTTSKQLEMTGVVLEALAYTSHKDVIPQYYEVALKTRTARDAESAAMLDLIFAGRIYDWGDTIFCNILRDGIFQEMMLQNNRDYASKTASIANVMQSSIDSIVEAFDSLS